MGNQCVIGVDFGTDSVHTLPVNAHTGETIGIHVLEYVCRKLVPDCNPAQSLFGQHPLDYLDGLSAGTMARRLIPYRSQLTMLLSISENDPIAPDWFNGRRTPTPITRSKQP